MVKPLPSLRSIPSRSTAPTPSARYFPPLPITVDILLNRDFPLRPSFSPKIIILRDWVKWVEQLPTDHPRFTEFHNDMGYLEAKKTLNLIQTIFQKHNDDRISDHQFFIDLDNALESYRFNMGFYRHIKTLEILISSPAYALPTRLKAQDYLRRLKEKKFNDFYDPDFQGLTQNQKEALFIRKYVAPLTDYFDLPYRLEILKSSVERSKNPKEPLEYHEKYYVRSILSTLESLTKNADPNLRLHAYHLLRLIKWHYDSSPILTDNGLADFIRTTIAADLLRCLGTEKQAFGAAKEYTEALSKGLTQIKEAVLPPELISDYLPSPDAPRRTSIETRSPLPAQNAHLFAQLHATRQEHSQVVRPGFYRLEQAPPMPEPPVLSTEEPPSTVFLEQSLDESTWAEPLPKASYKIDIELAAYPKRTP